MPQPVVRIKNLRKSFGDNEVLRGINPRDRSWRDPGGHRSERLRQIDVIALYELPRNAHVRIS